MNGDLQLNNKTKGGIIMEKDYLWCCAGCEKPDTDFWFNDDMEIECAEGIYGKPKVQDHQWAQSDAYGIYTGLYCNKCYNDPSIYTYKKDEYFDPSYAGECLEPEDY